MPDGVAALARARNPARDARANRGADRAANHVVHARGTREDEQLAQFHAGDAAAPASAPSTGRRDSAGPRKAQRGERADGDGEQRRADDHRRGRHPAAVQRRHMRMRPMTVFLCELGGADGDVEWQQAEDKPYRGIRRQDATGQIGRGVSSLARIRRSTVSTRRPTASHASAPAAAPAVSLAMSFSDAVRRG